MLAKAAVDRIVSRYPHGTAFQRWHMRGRLNLCPYDALLKHLTGRDTVLDVGCGFGHLAWYLEEERPDLGYLGADIDERKIALASGCAPGAGRPASPALPAFRIGEVTAMDDLRGPFGNIVILDVLYLLPWDSQRRLLEWCAERLSPEPGSALVIKTMDPPAGWSGARAVAEEWIMVRLLRRTRDSGTLNGAMPFDAYRELAGRLGLHCAVERLPTWNPSAILRFHRGRQPVQPSQAPQPDRSPDSPRDLHH